MIPIVANGLGIRAATVTSYHRVLREAGLVAKGRGRYAAPVTATDLARLLLTLMGSDSLEEAPAVCHLLCSAQCSVVDEETGQEERITLEDATAATLAQHGASPEPRSEAVGPFWSMLPLLEEIKVSGTELEATMVIDGDEIPFQIWSEGLPASAPEDWEGMTIVDRLLARSQFAHLRTMRSLHAVHLYDIASRVL
jgi:hypothetical protein